jgi:hypothetical protein
MADLFHEPYEGGAPYIGAQKAKRGHPEANLQTKIAQWCRESIRCRHKFKAFDRAKNSYAPGSDRGRHLYEWQKGIRRGTLDTCVITEGGVHHWIELKAPGVTIDPKEDEAQIKEIADLQALGGFAGWTNSVVGYARMLAEWSVPLHGLAMVRAEDLDRLLLAKKMKKSGKAPRSYRKPRGAAPSRAGMKFAMTHAALGRPK